MDLPLAGYGRVSRVGPRELERLLSPDQQKTAVERTGRELGREVVWFGAEVDVSGSKVNRPILDGIIARIEARELGGIIVSRLDRLARLKPRDRVELFERIEEAGGVVLSAAENLDPSTPEGRFARDVFLGVARMQWERYKEGFDAAKATAMERGATIGPTPFGYRRLPGGELEPDPADGPVLTEAFRRAGEAPPELKVDAALAVLAEHGGRTWTTYTVRRLLGKRSYLGEYRYGSLKATIPALVRRSVWEAAQPEPAKRRKPRADYPLSGLARCAGCDGPMVGGRGGPDGRRMYRCSASLVTSRASCPAPAGVTAALLEEHVVSALLEALSGHPGFEGGTDIGQALSEAQGALDAVEADRDDFLAVAGSLARTLGVEHVERQAVTHARAVDEARVRYRQAAREVEGRQRVTAADLVEGAKLEELGELLRGPLESVVVTKGRGALSGRVRLVTKGAPDAGATAGQEA
jgi:DNA invertase Pin-like site-specific DNA recombinase